jgi:aspartyl-tRNA(Asn)/glutamyl-tRNA(Gln) amidotransferase subunit B
VWAEVDGQERFFPLTRIHLEEDAGKTVHDPSRDRSLVDYNRAGVPLIETVSEPDLRSADEAVAYMKALHQVVVALGVCDGNMERGNFRCDANVSVRPVGQEVFGTRVELKNINSFRFVGRGIAYEIERQVAVLEDGGRIEQETRLWDEQAAMTRVLRGKEDAHDYRYFPDPDLITVEIDEAWIERVKASLPELPRERKKRYEADLGLNAYDAGVLTQSAALSSYFEEVCERVEDPKLVSNWVQGELLSWLNREERDIEKSPVSAQVLGEMLGLVQSGEISSKMAKACFAAMANEGVSPTDWLASHGGQITDEGAIEEVVSQVLDGHPEQVASYLEGKTKIMGFLVGQVMRATGGKANPQLVNQIAARLMEDRR